MNTEKVKVIVNSKEFQKALHTVGVVIKPPHPLPILDNVMIELSTGKLTLTGDNLEVRTKVSIDVINDVTLSTCVAYKLFSNILKGFPNEPIELIFQGNNITIKSQTGTYNLPLVDAGHFPEPKAAELTGTMSINANQLADAIKKAILFADNSSNLTNCNNVLIDITPEGTKVASTDKNVIFEYSISANGKAKALAISRSVAAHLVQSISVVEDIDLSYSDSHVFIIMPNLEINAILSNTGFPDYKRVFDSIENDKSLSIDKVNIVPALKRLYAITDQDNQTVVFNIDGAQLNLSFNNTFQNYSAKETVTCEYEGEKITIAFKASYINTLIGSIEDDIRMEMLSKEKPCVFRTKNIRAMLGPVTEN
jgi:DNA polymerase-3 subunit beta